MAEDLAIVARTGGHLAVAGLAALLGNHACTLNRRLRKAQP